MITISVRDAVRTFEAAKRELGERPFAQAVSRSINDTIMQGRTEARTQVKNIYAIPQRYVSGINIKKATSISLTANLFASASPIPMDAFNPKFQTPGKSITISRRGEQKIKTFKRAKSNTATGVSIEVIKGSRQVVPYAFLIPGGKPRVFARGQYGGGTSQGFTKRTKRENKSGSDTPVKPLISVSVHGAVINPQSLEKIEGRVNTVFPHSIERNISFMLSRVQNLNGL